MDKLTEQFDFFQNDGADEILRIASRDWESRNRGRLIVEARFIAAYPGDRNGRWVTIEVDHTLDRSYAHAD